MYGLVIKKKWLDKILAGDKTLEIRGSKTSRLKERIALIESGSSEVKGFCKIEENIGLDEGEWENLKSSHLVDISFDDLKKRYKNPYAWHLKEVVKLEQPIKYIHPQGAVIWVNLGKIGGEQSAY